MASIGKLPSGSYRVQFYVDGLKKSKTFKTRSEAKQFATKIELTPIVRGSSISFKTLLEEYRDTVTANKRGWREESIRINRILKYPMAQKKLSELTTQDLQSFVDMRLNEKSGATGSNISPATVVREFNHVTAVLHYAVRQGLIDKSPSLGVKLPKKPEHRERVATEEELDALLAASGWDAVSPPENLTQLTILAFLFSCRTGMRAGEILNLENSWIDGSVIHLPKEATKTLTKRDVALMSDARRLLDLAISASMNKGERIFGQLNSANRDAIWRKVRDRAGLSAIKDSSGNVIKEGLNFHDGRATFATWAASPNPKTGAPRLDVLALARQTGHRDLKMLQKYYRETAQEIARRLDDELA